MKLKRRRDGPTECEAVFDLAVKNLQAAIVESGTVEHHEGRIWVESRPGKGATLPFCGSRVGQLVRTRTEGSIEILPVHAADAVKPFPPSTRAGAFTRWAAEARKSDARNRLLTLWLKTSARKSGARHAFCALPEAGSGLEGRVRLMRAQNGKIG